MSTLAPGFGLRHYDRSQTEADPSSPLGGRKAANFPDEQAIGLTFSFDPNKGRLATITYLSGNKTISPKPSATPLAMAGTAEARGLVIKYREITPGVFEGTYSIQRLAPLRYFLFVLEGMLGHAI